MGCTQQKTREVWGVILCDKILPLAGIKTSKKNSTVNGKNPCLAGTIYAILVLAVQVGGPQATMVARGDEYFR